MSAFRDRGTNHYGRSRFFTSVAASMTAAVFIAMSQRLKGRLKALQLPPPVRVDETRNSILLVGIGGVGKTSLIRALTPDPAAEPDTTGPFTTC